MVDVRQNTHCFSILLSTLKRALHSKRTGKNTGQVKKRDSEPLQRIQPPTSLKTIKSLLIQVLSANSRRDPCFSIKIFCTVPALWGYSDTSKSRQMRLAIAIILTGYFIWNEVSQLSICTSLITYIVYDIYYVCTL